MTKSAVEEALERVLIKSNHSACWAQHVTKDTDAYAFLKGIEELEDGGTKVVRPKAAEEFVVFGVDITEGQVANHMQKKCRCR